MPQRPPAFNINQDSHLAQGLEFAGLGSDAGRAKMFDSSVYKKDATLVGMDPATDWFYVPELGRWGLDFDGTNDELSTQIYVNVRGRVTTSLWINTPSWNTNQNYIFGSISTGPENRWYYGYAALGIGDAYVTGITSHDPGRGWHHVALVATGVSAKLYYDGQVDYTVASYGADSDSTANLLFGTRNWTTKDYGDFSLSDILQYTRDLSVSEIQELADPTNAYLSGLITYSTPKSFVSFYNIPIPGIFRRVGATFNSSPISRHTFVGGIK